MVLVLTIALRPNIVSDRTLGSSRDEVGGTLIEAGFNWNDKDLFISPERLGPTAMRVRGLIGDFGEGDTMKVIVPLALGNYWARVT